METTEHNTVFHGMTFVIVSLNPSFPSLFLYHSRRFFIRLQILAQLLLADQTRTAIEGMVRKGGIEANSLFFNMLFHTLLFRTLLPGHHV